MPRRRMQKKRAPRRRRARKGARKYNRVPGGRLQLKPYTFNFKPEPQAIISNLITPGSASIAPSARQLPMLNANFALRSNTLSAAITTVTDWGVACSFALSDLTNFQNFVNMYDAYKINYVTVKLYYLNNFASVGSSSLMPTFYMYADQDDIVVPTSAIQIGGKQGVRKWQPTASKLTTTFKIRPVTNTTVEAVGSLSTANAVVPNTSLWLDCANASIPHFGFKMYCQDWSAQGNTSTFNVVRVAYTYNVSFRSPLQTS